MRVGFTGSQGTGKTTTADLLLPRLQATVEPSESGHFVPWKSVPSTARQALKAGYSINRDADELSQLLTTLARINAENGVAEYGNVLSDRTPIDSLAYTLYQADNVWEKENEFYIEQSIMVAYDHMNKYDFLFYFPVYWAPQGDGVRDTDVEYQRDIDRYISDMLDLSDLDYIEMPNDTPENRVEFIMDHIRI